MTDVQAPVERALVVVAHPDDLDFGAAGTIATWEDDVLRANDVVVAGRPEGTVLLRFTPGNLRHDAARVAAQLAAVLL